MQLQSLEIQELECPSDEHSSACACGSVGSTCVAVGSNVTVLSGGLTRAQSAFTTDAPVDAVALCRDGSLLAAGLRSGHLLLFDVNQGTKLEDKDLTKEANGSTFSHLEFASQTSDMGVGSLLVLWSRGNVCVLNGSSERAQWQPQVLQLKTEAISFASFFANGEKLLCSEKEASISAWKCSPEGFEQVDCISLVLQGDAVEKTAFTEDESLLVTSQQNGTIAVWSTLLFVLVSLCRVKGVLKDFVLWDSLHCHSSSVMSPHSKEVLVCTLVEDEGRKELFLLSLPHLKTTNVISVAMETQLVSGPSALSALCYTEEDVDSGKIGVKMIVEAKEQDRLDGLISSQRYEEAVCFAVEHNLDTKEIYRSQAAFLLGERVSKKDLATVVQCLERISDVPFVVELCCSAVMQDCASVATLLQYCVKKVDSLPQEEEPTRSPLQAKVQGMLHRLATFSLILGAQEFSGTLWHHFKTARLPDIIHLLLSEKKLSEASTVWLQHQGELLKELDAERVTAMLACVPEGVPIEEVSVFSEAVAAFLIHHLPDPLDHFVDWFAEKVHFSVAEDTTPMLEECLLATRKLLALFHSAVRQRDRHPLVRAAHAGSEAFVNPGATKKLEGLLVALEELKYLLHTLNLSGMSLEQVIENKEVLVRLMLDKVIAPEQFPQVVREQVSPYCCRHKMNLDQTLVCYVKHFLSRIPVQTSCDLECLEELPWETRILALIACIKAEGAHLEAVCELVTHSRIPWSPEVEALVQNACGSRLPQVEELERHCQFVQLKTVAHMYNFSPAELEYLPARKPRGIIRKIIYSGAENSLKDALKIVNMCKVSVVDVYVTYVKFLARNDKVDDVEALLPTLPHPTAKEVACRMVAEGMVGSSPLSTQLAIVGARFLVSQDQQAVPEGSEWTHIPLQEVVSVLGRMQLLQRSYSEWPLFGSLMDEAFCRKQVKQRMDSSQSSTTIKDLEKLLRYAQLYGVPREWVLCELLLQSVKEKQFERAALVCRSLQDRKVPTSPVVGQIRSAVECLWRVLAESPSTVLLPASLSPLLDALAELSPGLLANCASEDLLSLQELAHNIRFMASVEKQCSTSTKDHSTQRLSQALWKEVLDPVYCEEALMMQQSLALPAVARFHLAGTAFTLAGLVVDEFVKLSSSLATVLRENGLNQLALDCAQETLHTLRLHCLLEGEDLGPLESKGSDFIKTLVTALTEAVLRYPKLDHLYAVSLLVSLPRNQARQLLVASRKLCKGYSKMMAFSDLCIHLGTVLGSKDMVSTASYFYRIAKWGKKLREYQVDYSGALKGDRHQVELSTLKGLMLRGDIPFQVLMDYAHDIEQPLAVILPQYLLSVLVKWRERSYQQRALVVLRRLSPLEAREVLMKAQAKVCSYDYERLEFILEQLDAKAGRVEVHSMTKNLALLRWMKEYERQSQPSEYEAEFYTQCHGTEEGDSVDNALPPLSSSHLPYHALVYGNARRILTPELTLSSMESLLKVASLLMIPKDEVLILTIKNTAQLFGAEDASRQHKKQTVRLGEVFDRIGDPQLAVACGQWMKHTLKGEIRIRMMEKTAAVAQKWLSSVDTEEERVRAGEAVEELLQEVRTSSIQFTLERNDLASEGALELIDQPEDLIVHLYTEETVTAAPFTAEHIDVPTAPCLKVHEAAREIANVCQLDLQRIQKHLLNAWLQLAGCKHTTQSPLDATLDTTQLALDETLPLSDGQSAGFSCNQQEEEKYFQRLVYLMSEDGRIEDNVSTLLSYAKRSGSGFPYKARRLALRVVLQVAPPEVVQRVADKSLVGVMEYSQVLHILSELEVLGIPTDLQAYLGYNKTVFVKGILKSHSHQPKALNLMVDVMTFHSLLDPVLWEQVLHLLMDAKLVATLRRALLFLAKASPSDCSVTTCVGAWRYLLKQPLKDVEVPVTGQQKDVLLNNFKLLLQCPYLLSVDLPFFVKSYHRLQQPALALACACLLPSSQEREAFVKSLGKSLDPLAWGEVERELQHLPIPPHIRAAVNQDMHALQV